MSRIADTLVTYRLLKLLSTPIKNSQAFQMGLVDGDGKQLRKANTKLKNKKFAVILFVFILNFSKLVLSISAHFLLCLIDLFLKYRTH